tara:strand:+ start:27087 stop:27413 length:327 start_codon:yes stop_codon:yes gene_type:complete
MKYFSKYLILILFFINYVFGNPNTRLRGLSTSVVVIDDDRDKSKDIYFLIIIASGVGLGLLICLIWGIWNKLREYVIYLWYYISFRFIREEYDDYKDNNCINNCCCVV